MSRARKTPYPDEIPKCIPNEKMTMPGSSGACACVFELCVCMCACNLLFPCANRIMGFCFLPSSQIPSPAPDNSSGNHPKATENPHRSQLIWSNDRLQIKESQLWQIIKTICSHMEAT